MKKILLPIVSLFIFMSSFAQKEPNVDEIKNSGKYLLGFGNGTSYQQADKNAIGNLSNQISVQIENSFEDIVKETNGNLKEYTESIMKSYSNAILVSSKDLLIKENEGKLEVLRYLRKEDLNNIFANRELKIFDYIKSGFIAENNLRIGDALRDFYWAFVLLRSHKDNENLRYDFPEQENQLLITALSDKINTLFASIIFSIDEIEDVPAKNYKMIQLKPTFKGKPVENLDFSYWTGRNYSKTFSCNSSIGIVELIGEKAYTLDELKLVVEYSYNQKTVMDMEVKSVFEYMDIPYFDAAEFKILLYEDKNQDSSEVVEKSEEIDFGKMDEVGVNDKIKDNVLQIIGAIENKNYSGIDELFTESGRQVFDALIVSGNPKVLPIYKSLNFISLGKKSMVRSIPMMLSYKNSRRSFAQNVVFTFDPDQKVEAISFAISDKAIKGIVSKSERFGTIKDKYSLINFMEHYKTAYCLKRIDYIGKIFADNALIIIGSIVKEAEPIEGMYKKLGNNTVKYLELDKKGYIERLKKVFNSNEYVNIQFEENIVKKVNGDKKIYGIQIKQYYYSTSYADKGYLFLMIDLNDSINPKIYVRTWQPEKNPDGSIYGLNDFEIN